MYRLSVALGGTQPAARRRDWSARWRWGDGTAWDSRAAFRLVDDLSELGVERLVLAPAEGRDPLNGDTLPELIERAAATGLDVDVQTRGWPLPPALLRRLARTGVMRATVDLLGPSRIHDGIQHRRGAFRLAVDTLAALLGAGVPAGVRFPLGQRTLPWLAWTLDLAGRSEARHFQVTHWPDRPPDGDDVGSPLRPRQVRHALDVLLASVHLRREPGAMPEVTTSSGCADAVYGYLWCVRRRPELAPVALDEARLSAAVRPDLYIGSAGDVFISGPADPLRLGSVRQERLTALWGDRRRSAWAAWRRSLDLSGSRCAVCRWLRLCSGVDRALWRCGRAGEDADQPVCFLRAREVEPDGPAVLQAGTG